MVTRGSCCHCCTSTRCCYRISDRVGPGVLADKLIWPVAVLTNTSPAVDENVPATPPPLNVGLGFAAFWQYGVPV